MNIWYFLKMHEFRPTRKPFSLASQQAILSRMKQKGTKKTAMNAYKSSFQQYDYPLQSTKFQKIRTDGTLQLLFYTKELVDFWVLSYRDFFKK